MSENEQEFNPLIGLQPRPWAILVYGVPGVGKSTLGTFAPQPFFIDLESGLNWVDCHKTPKRITSLDEVLSWLRWFMKSDYKTVIIDTVDELEKFFGAKVVADYNREANKPVKTVADIPYGRGGDLMIAQWRSFIDVVEHVKGAGKNVILTGHEQIVKFENPTDSNYDFYTVNINKKAAPIVTAKMDAVLFAKFETYVVKDGQKGKASTTGNRVLMTSQGASWVAKNRFGFSGSMPMSGELFQKIGGEK